LSRSAPIIFSQRLRPPTDDGGATGAGVAEGVCEGVTDGVCDGVIAGVWDGVTLGVLDGVLGVVCAKAVPAIARRATALRVFNMMSCSCQ